MAPWWRSLDGSPAFPVTWSLSERGREAMNKVIIEICHMRRLRHGCSKWRPGYFVTMKYIITISMLYQTPNRTSGMSSMLNAETRQSAFSNGIICPESKYGSHDEWRSQHMLDIWWQNIAYWIFQILFEAWLRSGTWGVLNDANGRRIAGM